MILPEDVSVGVICVGIGGGKIEYFDKAFDESMLSGKPDWLREIVSSYDNQPTTDLCNARNWRRLMGRSKA